METLTFRDRVKLGGRRAYSALRPQTTGFLVVSVAVGSASGLLSVFFSRAIELIHTFSFDTLLRWIHQELGVPVAWATPTVWRLLLPMFGALLMAWLTLKLFKAASNPGIPIIMMDARTKPGNLPPRYVAAAFIAGALIIGTGGSAGREAPVVAMGGILGGWIGSWLGLTKRRKQILIGCGAGAAIAAAYNAPMAGLFFGVEIILGDYTAATISPALLASVAGTVVARSLEGVGAERFIVPPYHFVAWWEIALYAGLGLASGLVAPLFVFADRALHRYFHEWTKLPVILRPAIGGLGVGVLALALPQVMGNGYNHVQAALAGGIIGPIMLALVFGKILATSLTLGSGGWGGDFAPLLFMGAMLGGAYGTGLARLFPHLGLVPGSYAIVGMGALLTAAVRCPITAILLLFEVTGSYQVILPIMTAVAVAIPVSRIFLKRGMYHGRLEEMGGPASELSETRILETVQIAQIVKPNAVNLAAGTPYREILRVISSSDQLVYPVLHPGGRLMGVLTLRELRGYLDAVELADLVVAEDVATEDIPVLTVNDTLERAMHLFAESDLEELPVVTDLESRQFVGLLTRRQAFAARGRVMAEWEMEER
ncbi:MAG: chloride channel protein [Acidobacteria bacterium]|nr:chloride channel protein [Acidobacteriota bacterium]